MNKIFRVLLFFYREYIYIHMTTITISKKLIREKELIVIPRKKYEEFVNLEKLLKNRIAEEKDIDKAIAIYIKEKSQNKLKTLKSLADLR